MADDSRDLLPVGRTSHYASTVLDSALERLDPQSLWLVLSIDHYGWRAHLDLGAALLEGEALPSGDLATHFLEHRMLAAIEEMFLLTDQIWRTIEGIRAARAGDSFIATYCKWGGDMASTFKALRSIDGQEWAELLALPDDAELAALLAAEGGSAVEISHMQNVASELRALGPLNLEEIMAFFERPGSALPDCPGFSLRDINNQYRHGTRVLHDDCAPTDSGWVASNPSGGHGTTTAREALDERSREATVSVLMEPPDADGRAHVASLGYDSAMRESVLDAMRHLSAILKRLTRSFIATSATGRSTSLAALEDVEWEPLERDA